MALFTFMNCAGNRPFRFAIALLLPLAGGCDSAEEKAARYQSRAMENLARGEFDKAALDFRNVLRLEPNDAQALLGLGQVEEHRRNFDAAAKIYLSLAGRDTQNLESRVRLARLLLASGQFEAAERYAGQAYRLAPADPRVLAGKAGVALGRGEREEAVRLARAALQGAPGDATALMVLASDRAAASDFAGALDLLDRGKAEGGADLNLQLLKLKILQAMGDREKVEELFGDLSRQFPQSPVLRDHLVKWRLDNGRYADAEQAARDHARANGGDVAAQVKLVKVIARTRGTKAAIAEVKGIIAAAQDEERIAELGSAQAMLEFEAGEPEAALATLNDLIASLKDDAVRAGAQVKLARMLNDMKRWEAALEPADAALESDPRNADALEARAVSRMALGRNGGAVEDLVAGLVEKPGSASLTLLLAEAYERTGSAVLAEEQYSKALALTRHAPQGAMKLARFYLRYGRTGDAMTLLEELRSRGTADREALALLGQLKLDAGDWQGAQELAADLRRVDGPAGETADFILAGALAGMNRHAEGVEMLRARLSRAADPQAAATELVLGYLRAGRFREAETLARDRLAQNGASPHWQVVLGTVLMAEGRA
ncbi:MAG: tetratricopeptide repeat protein, partial [Nitratireductor sp.]|nr:tetratricopeptide repeat protein [Nitratireductor sp.]